MILKTNVIFIKLFLIMLKINNLDIKIFHALYIFRIYVEYMYMCVHMCIMNHKVHGGAYIFSLLFGIVNDCVMLFIYKTDV